MKKILIVEDDQKIAMALAIRLKANGYEASVAPDALAGSSQARAFRPDLILLDISMPGGNGFQLAEEFLRMPQTNGTPMIFITASKQPEIRSKIEELGAVGLLEKPFDTEELLLLIDRQFNPVPALSNAAESSVAPQNHRNNEKILVIEDDRKLAKALTIRLKFAGFETTTAYDAMTGVNAAVQNPPDLVLLDISLPAGDGFAVVKRIRDLVHKPIPIIFITASKDPSFQLRATELGAAGYFEKPYEVEDLLAAIQHTLKRAQPGSITPGDAT